MSTGSRFVYPTGKTPEQLFLTLKTLIDTLNRIQSEDATDLSGINDAISAAMVEIGGILSTIEGINSTLSGVGDTLADIEANGGVTDQQAFELSLVTQINTMLGSVGNSVLESIKQSQIAAEATIRALLEGHKNKIAISVEQTARLTDKEAFVAQNTTFTAQLQAALAQISQEIVARSDGDSALASSIDTVTTALNGNIAQVQIIAESVDGIEQKFTVSLNENGQVVGLIGLDGTPAGSTFTVVADKLKAAHPSVNGGDPITFLNIETIAGVPTFVFNGLIKVLSLSSLSANMGTVTAGTIIGLLLRNADNTSYWDLETGDFQIG
jgi:hypothetical protein